MPAIISQSNSTFVYAINVNRILCLLIIRIHNIVLIKDNELHKLFHTLLFKRFECYKLYKSARRIFKAAHSKNAVVTESLQCRGCSDPITDRFLLKVSDKIWHVSCLRCCVCNLVLEDEPSCFIKDDSIYCRQDYARNLIVNAKRYVYAISSNPITVIESVIPPLLGTECIISLMQCKPNHNSLMSTIRGLKLMNNSNNNNNNK
ncbi:hypothetical protein AGLY_014864 [Aphis glycines]|uniref:LIM zinc-binding domain-containing protein n=1 Tax=Aphis glycines TaxID=307491 RepID=A0A6G0T3P3_APHGL|nr:hypothetical protein AGLY_014864 [Aphis glycines]